MPRQPDPPSLSLSRRPGRAPVYYIRWTENGRDRRRSTGESSRREANRKLQEFRRSQAPDLKGHRLDEIYLGDVLAQYAADSAARVADPARIGHAVQNLIPFWAAITVADVSEQSAREYTAARRLDRAADGTIRRELSTLAAALNQAASRGVIHTAPTIWKPARPEPRANWLTRLEVANLLRAARLEPKARPHLPMFIRLGFYSGSRKEALLSLRWRPNSIGGHVDLQRRRISFNPIGRVQTKKRRAVIPIPPQMMAPLTAAARLGHETVIADRHGAPLANIKRSFSTAARAAGVPWATPHTLRHTCITHLLLNGASRYDVSEWCAISMDELERTYGHHAPDFLESTAQTWRASNRRSAAR